MHVLTKLGLEALPAVAAGEGPLGGVSSGVQGELRGSDEAAVALGADMGPRPLRVALPMLPAALVA